jgi:hypothetical protein
MIPPKPYYIGNPFETQKKRKKKTPDTRSRVCGGSVLGTHIIIYRLDVNPFYHFQICL